MKIISLAPTWAYISSKSYSFCVNRQLLKEGFQVEVLPGSEGLNKKWDSLSKRWTSCNMCCKEPTHWDDAHWAMVDKTLEAMNNFDNLYNKE